MNHHHYLLHHGVGFDVMGMSPGAITAALGAPLLTSPKYSYLVATKICFQKQCNQSKTQINCPNRPTETGDQFFPHLLWSSTRYWIVRIVKHSITPYYHPLSRPLQLVHHKWQIFSCCGESLRAGHDFLHKLLTRCRFLCGIWSFRGITSLFFLILVTLFWCVRLSYFFLPGSWSRPCSFLLIISADWRSCCMGIIPIRHRLPQAILECCNYSCWQSRADIEPHELVTQETIIHHLSPMIHHHIIFYDYSPHRITTSHWPTGFSNIGRSLPE